jgi:hypothetical protein
MGHGGSKDPMREYEKDSRNISSTKEDPQTSRFQDYKNINQYNISINTYYRYIIFIIIILFIVLLLFLFMLKMRMCVNKKKIIYK